MTRRRGVSLIEMIAAMGAAAVMLGVAVTLLYALLRTEGSARDHIRQGNALELLADQFRRDVHAATTAAAAPDGREWRFELGPGHTATYRLGPGTPSRVEQVDGQVQRRESFALPPGSTASIQVQDDTRPSIVSLMISPAAEESQGPPRLVIRIDAALASDHRFTKLQKP